MPSFPWSVPETQSADHACHAPQQAILAGWTIAWKYADSPSCVYTCEPLPDHPQLACCSLNTISQKWAALLLYNGY